MNSYNSAKIDKDIAQLIDDDEIKKTKGIWQYELAINSGGSQGLLNTLITWFSKRYDA